MLQHKGKRTQASLLIDWTPPRVWMEALEGRRLTSSTVVHSYSEVDQPTPPPVVMVFDESVRKGFFHSIYERELWGDSTHVAGTLATFFGDAPKVDRAYIRQEADWWVEGSVDSKWTSVALVDVPGPTFEIQGDLPAGAAQRDALISTTIALLDDHGGPSYLVEGPKVFFTDHDFITKAPQPLNYAWDWNHSRLGTLFYDRVEENRKYHVLVEWLDSSASETFEVNGSVWGIKVDSTHNLKLGTAFRMTVTAESSTDSISFTGDVSLEDLQPSTPWVPAPQPEHAITTQRDIDVGETFDIFAEFTTSHFLADGTMGEVEWAQDKNEPVTASFLSTEKDATTGSTFYRYSLRVAPRSLPSGSYYYQFKFSEGSDGVEGYGNLIIRPDRLTVPTQWFHTASSMDVHEGEIPSSGHDGFEVWDREGHSKADYTAYFEFPDGQRGPAFVEGKSNDVLGLTHVTVQPAFALWNPLTSQYNEGYVATLVISRAGSTLSHPVTINVMNNGWWIRPASEDSLRYANVPELISIELPEKYYFKGRDAAISIPIEIANESYLDDTNVTFSWDDGNTSPGAIVKMPDGSYQLQASHQYGEPLDWMYWEITVQIDLFGKSFATDKMLALTGDGGGLSLDYDFNWVVPADVDWGRLGYAQTGPIAAIFGEIDGPVTAEAVFDDGLPARVYLERADMPIGGEGFTTFTTYLQTTLPSPGEYWFTLLVHAGSQTYSIRSSCEDWWGMDAELITHYYEKALPVAPLTPLSAEALDAFRIDREDYDADAAGNVSLHASLNVMDADSLDRTTFSVDWGDGSSSPGALVRSKTGKWTMLADHYYEVAGSHAVVLRGFVSGQLIELVRLNVSSTADNTPRTPASTLPDVEQVQFVPDEPETSEGKAFSPDDEIDVIEIPFIAFDVADERDLKQVSWGLFFLSRQFKRGTG